MAIVDARKDSNAARSSDNHGPPEGPDLEKGFTLVPYEKDMPARHNSDIGSLSNSIGSMGNDGTSAEAYKSQPVDIKNSEDPNLPK